MSMTTLGGGAPTGSGASVVAVGSPGGGGGAPRLPVIRQPAGDFTAGAGKTNVTPDQNGAVTIMLPDISVAGDGALVVLNIPSSAGGLTLTISPIEGQTINGLADFEIANFSTLLLWFTSDGISDWVQTNQFKVESD